MTTSPNFSLEQIVDPIPYSAVEGTYPNPETYIQAELMRVFLEMQARFQADDAAIVSYFQTQLTQVSNLINGLAGGEDLQAALEVLERLQGIVDSNGDGILDALSPINGAIANLQSAQTAAQQQLSTQQTTLEALQTTQQSLQQSVGTLGQGVATAVSDARKGQAA